MPSSAPFVVDPTLTSNTTVGAQTRCATQTYAAPVPPHALIAGELTNRLKATLRSPCPALSEKTTVHPLFLQGTPLRRNARPARQCLLTVSQPPSPLLWSKPWLSTSLPHPRLSPPPSLPYDYYANTDCICKYEKDELPPPGVSPIHFC